MFCYLTFHVSSKHKLLALIVQQKPNLYPMIPAFTWRDMLRVRHSDVCARRVVLRSERGLLAAGGGVVSMHLLRRSRPPTGALCHHDGNVLLPGKTHSFLRFFDDILKWEPITLKKISSILSHQYLINNAMLAHKKIISPCFKHRVYRYN